jgi:biopolymer transport protein ExbD
VIINADRAATHQSVIDVLEAARIAGLAKVTFAAQAEAVVHNGMVILGSI